jgi:hypothetical protein
LVDIYIKAAFCLLLSGFLHNLPFVLEDESDMFLRNISRLPPDYTTVYVRQEIEVFIATAT